MYIIIIITLGFAVLDFFVNNAGIMKYLKKNWDQLLKTQYPPLSTLRGEQPSEHEDQEAPGQDAELPPQEYHTRS